MCLSASARNEANLIQNEIRYEDRLLWEMASDIAQCPECGWTGSESDFDIDVNERNCPICQYTFMRV